MKQKLILFIHGNGNRYMGMSDRESDPGIGEHWLWFFEPEVGYDAIRSQH